MLTPPPRYVTLRHSQPHRGNVLEVVVVSAPGGTDLQHLGGRGHEDNVGQRSSCKKITSLGVKK